MTLAALSAARSSSVVGRSREFGLKCSSGDASQMTSFSKTASAWILQFLSGA
jgi:hypothetical protein